MAIIQPSSTTKPQFSSSIADKILIELDGWQVIIPPADESSELEPFLNTDDPDVLKNIGTNHSVTLDEVQSFYDSAFDEALAYTNRLDINDLDEITLEIFMMAVYKLAASNLWNKYNIQINNDAMEGTYVVSQGGRLYKKACNILDKFVRTSLIGINSLNKHNFIELFILLKQKNYAKLGLLLKNAYPELYLLLQQGNYSDLYFVLQEMIYSNY